MGSWTEGKLLREVPDRRFYCLVCICLRYSAPEVLPEKKTTVMHLLVNLTVCLSILSTNGGGKITVLYRNDIRPAIHDLCLCKILLLLRISDCPGLPESRIILE